MKNKGTVVIAGCLVAILLGLFCFSASAENVRNPLAIDMIIVIENSHRMTQANTQDARLDRKGLRFDAAAALISMCDSKYSRANYFLFNNNLYTYHPTATDNVTEVSPSDIALFDISLPRQKTQRQSLMEVLNGSRIRSGNGTRAGADIGKALSAAVDVQMRELNNGNRKVILMLTAGNNNLSDASLRQAEEAKRRADENGIEIYAVALTDSSSAQLLHQLVTSPDHYQYASTPEDLVDVYRNFFASMIGADPMESRSVKLDGNQAEILLEIPNDSVAEVNIILPLRQVEDLTLTDPDGKLIARTEDNVLVSKSSNFISYKLISPKSSTYRLSYSSENENNIVVQYVFSYGVQAEASVSSLKVNKHEPVTISAKYMVDGIPTTDSKLYNIPATLTLWKGTKVISVTEMEHDGENYYLTFNDLAQYGIGEYSASIHLEGDGLKRDVENVTFELMNNSPELISASVNGERYDVTINIPRDADSYVPDRNARQWDLNAFVRDINGDALVPEIVANTANVSAALDGMNLTIKPVQNAATEGEVRIVVRDTDGGESPELIFPVHVSNYENQYDAITAHFDPVKGIEKNSTCELTLRMYDSEGNEIRSDDQVPDQVIAVLEESGSQPQDVVMIKEGAHWTGSFRTGGNATEYTVKANIPVGQKTIAAESLSISSENKAPSLRVGARANQTWSQIINEPSEADSYLIKQKVWNLLDLVEDLNGDQITFTIDRSATTANVEASVNSADQTLTISTKLNTETDGDVVVKCQDNDGLAGPDLFFHVTVTSNEEKYKAYTAELQPDGHGKSRDIVFTLSVLDENGMLVTGDTNLPGQLDATYTLNNEQKPMGMTRGSDGKWTGSFKTVEKEAQYTVSAAVRVSDNVSIVAPDYLLSTVNSAPVIIRELDDAELVPETIQIDPFLFWSNSTGEIVIQDLNEYFKDPDGDPLTYSLDTTFQGTQVEADIQGNTLTIRGTQETPEAVSFTVTARDTEGLTATGQPVSFNVKSLKKQGIITLILIAAALLAIFVIYQICKPSFQSQYFDVFVKRAGGELLSQGKSTNLKGKKSVKLGNFTTANAKQASGTDIPVATLNKVTLAPAYGSRVKVKIDAMDPVTVKVGTARLTPKKQASVAVNGTLSLENNGTEVQFRLAKAGPAVPSKPQTTPKAGAPTSAGSGLKQTGNQRTNRT